MSDSINVNGVHAQFLIPAKRTLIDRLITEDSAGFSFQLLTQNRESLLRYESLHKPRNSLERVSVLANQAKQIHPVLEILENLKILEMSPVCKLADCETAAADQSLCSQCKLVNYCGKEHQKEDWARHKPE